MVGVGVLTKFARDRMWIVITLSISDNSMHVQTILLRTEGGFKTIRVESKISLLESDIK